MAFEGELVRMENGRWARYQSLRVYGPSDSPTEGATLLVAVELDEHQQSLLADAEASLVTGGRDGLSVPAGQRHGSGGDAPVH